MVLGMGFVVFVAWRKGKALVGVLSLGGVTSVSLLFRLGNRPMPKWGLALGKDVCYMTGSK